MKQKNSKENSLQDEIINSMKRSGKWYPELQFQVETLAGLIKIYRQLVQSMDHDDLVVKEISREGDERMKPNPKLNTIATYSDQIRKSLKSLQLNYELKPLDIGNVNEDEPIVKLLKTVNG